MEGTAERVFKMPSSCAVASCVFNYHKAKQEGKQLSYFSFPSDPAVRELWVRNCGRSVPFNTKTSRVCSMHFADDCYERDLQHELLNLKPRLMLKPGSVPTLLLGDKRKRKQRVTERNVSKEIAFGAPVQRKRSRLDSVGILKKSCRVKEAQNKAANENGENPHSDKHPSRVNIGGIKKDTAESPLISSQQQNNDNSEVYIITQSKENPPNQTPLNSDVLLIPRVNSNSLIMVPSNNNEALNSKCVLIVQGDNTKQTVTDDLKPKLNITLPNDKLPENERLKSNMKITFDANSNCLLLREETLAETVERQRGEIKGLLAERCKLQVKVADQEKQLAYLKEKYENLEKEKSVKAVIYNIKCKHKSHES